jgi:hypothetical protein
MEARREKSGEGEDDGPAAFKLTIGQALSDRSSYPAASANALRNAFEYLRQLADIPGGLPGNRLLQRISSKQRGACGEFIEGPTLTVRQELVVPFTQCPHASFVCRERGDIRKQITPHTQNSYSRDTR